VQLERVIESLVNSIAQKEREVSEFQAKYKIRFKSDGDDQQAHQSDETSGSAGVLV
jgi:hypothetical protein